MVVGDICNCFGGSGKDRGTVCPPHWEDKGEGDELFFVWSSRENNTQFWYVVHVDVKMVESVTVNL